MIALLAVPVIAKASDDDKSMAEKVLQEPSHMTKVREGVFNALTLGYYNKHKEAKAEEEAKSAKEKAEETKKKGEDEVEKEKDKHKKHHKKHHDEDGDDDDLPPGLAKKDGLPPGLAKKKKAPGGWVHGETGWKKEKD